MSKSTLTLKEPALRGTPYAPKLFIDDLLKMSRSGNHDLNVLLWLQDRYIGMAITKHADDLIELHRTLADQGHGEDHIRRKKGQAVMEYTRTIYNDERKHGRGANLDSYIAAAEVFYEVESTKYEGYLKDVADHLKQHVGRGTKPQLQSLAVHCYTVINRFSSVQEHMERMTGKAAAQALHKRMEIGIGEINFTQVADQPTEIGRRLLQFIGEVHKNKAHYMEFKDPNAMPEVPREAWDFEPVDRVNRSTPEETSMIH